MVDPLVFSMRASASSCEAVTSDLDRSDVVFPYMPSLNVWLSDEGPILAMVPHEESMTAAAIASSELFFILFFSYL